MKVICKVPLASIHTCVNCGALLYYGLEDIYENKYIYCPICKTKQECACDLSYDGVIKDDSTTKGKE